MHPRKRPSIARALTRIHPITQYLQTRMAVPSPTLGEVVSAIDNAIRLHYATHTAPPNLTAILASSSRLLSYKLTRADVARVCHHSPVYTITERSDGELCIDMASVSDRGEVAKSTTALLGSTPDDVGLAQFVRRSKTPTSLPTKVGKHYLLLTLSNRPDKFTFKQRSESDVTAKLGLLLLERIKLKETKRKLELATPSPTPEEAMTPVYAAKVYDILFCQLDGKITTYELERLVTTCRQLILVPLATDDIKGAIKYVADRLPQVSWVERHINDENVTVVRVVGPLNRHHDLAKIASNPLA